jgi:serine phosphatase RsbU (regulator of sigma subunit)
LLYVERSVAYLQLDARCVLAAAGGCLEHYGLTQLYLGGNAIEQVHCLEGFIPLPESPFIVPSVELYSGRVADIHLHQEGEQVWVVLLDATLERDATRRVQQKAYDMTLAREREAALNQRLQSANAALVAAHRQLESSRAALAQSHEHLQRELAEAAGYVRSLLPEPMAKPFAIDWVFEPSAALGGDSFGYHWIDSEHFALYLLDVCGHGVGPSLLSVAVLHVLQAASLRDVNFCSPAQVLQALNRTYEARRPEDLFFTLWYGVYRYRSRQLTFGCAGHPPAVLMEPGGQTKLLKAKGPPIGLMPGAVFQEDSTLVPPDHLLFLLSDGVFEVERPDGTMQTFAEFLELLSTHSAHAHTDLSELLRQALSQRSPAALEDDFSLVRFVL